MLATLHFRSIVQTLNTCAVIPEGKKWLTKVQDGVNMSSGGSKGIVRRPEGVLVALLNSTASPRQSPQHQPITLSKAPPTDTSIKKLLLKAVSDSTRKDGKTFTLRDVNPAMIWGEVD